MKFATIILSLLTGYAALAQSHTEKLISTSDIDLFWKAYDQIATLQDEAEQMKILETEYIQPGSEGLKSLMRKRGYTAESYVDAINQSPAFWNSIRKNTLKSRNFAQDILFQIQNLRSIYPDLKPASIYFTIGAMMTGGSAYEGHVLIGSEIAMADSSTVIEDIKPDYLQENLARYFKSNPINDVVLLNVHEYVHTQQGDYGYDLLSMSLFEGIAEFVSVLATKTPSAAPAISYGQKHLDKVRERFQKEMFSPHWNDWLYNNYENEFGVRDLGYFVGYAIAESYYNLASSKQAAIKEMIELDCSSEKSVRNFIEKSSFLTNDYEQLKKEYKDQRPQVLGLKEFENGSQNVNSNLKTISILFSKEMNPRFRNFKLGKLGEEHLLPFSKAEWSEDRKSIIFEVELESNKRYQIIVDHEFRDTEGRPIANYSIDFKTMMH